MLDYFEAPLWLLLLLPLMAVLAWDAHRRTAGGWLGDRRMRRRLALRGLAALAMVFALAGARWPGAGITPKVVAAADLSASVYDRGALNAALEDLAAGLEPARPELAVVVFGRRAGTARQPAPLPAFSQRRERGRDPDPTGPPPLPNLLRPATEIDPSASDYGAAIEWARPLFGEARGARAIVLIGDGLDTQGRAELAAAGLNGSGIDLLVWPLALGGTQDVRLAGLRLPERAPLGRGIPIEVTVAGPVGAETVVRVACWQGLRWESVGSAEIALEGSEKAAEARRTVHLSDLPKEPGVRVYRARIEGRDGKPLLGDFKQNNALDAALRVEGPRRWAVLAAKDSTLARWVNSPGRPLGVDVDYYPPERFPRSAEAYRGLTGVLAGGLSADDLAPDSPALQALAAAMREGPQGEPAVRGGLGLIAVGSERAFGAGKHPLGGVWEGLLPVTFRPEDDRTRTILFLLDLSKSMDERMPDGRTQKLEHARTQLGLAARSGETAAAFQPADRVGLVVFSSGSEVIAPVRTDPTRAVFVEALGKLVKTQSQTNILGALQKAQELLAQDDAEERLVVLVSDGQSVPAVADETLVEAVKGLCPAPETGGRRRTALFAFGIGTGESAGESGRATMQKLAAAGGGRFIEDFGRLAARLREVFEEDRKDLYARHEPFAVQRTAAHPVLDAAGSSWPLLPFRNRVKERPEAQVLLRSAPAPGSESEKASHKPDPILTLGRLGASRTAALALALEGEAGEAFLTPGEGWRGGQALLAALLSWAEGDDSGTAGWRVETEAGAGETLRVILFAEDPQTARPDSSLELDAELAPLGEGEREGFSAKARLLPVAPGRYEADLRVPHEGVGRLLVRAQDGRTLERFVTAPYPPEFRRFASDRVAMQAWVARAGGDSRLVNVPLTDLRAWLEAKGNTRSWTSLRPALLILAMLFFLAEIAMRGMRARGASNL